MLFRVTCNRCGLSHLMLTTALWSQCCHNPCFIDEETETQRGLAEKGHICTLSFWAVTIISPGMWCEKYSNKVWARALRLSWALGDGWMDVWMDRWMGLEVWWRSRCFTTFVEPWKVWGTSQKLMGRAEEWRRQAGTRKHPTMEKLKMLEHVHDVKG